MQPPMVDPARVRRLWEQGLTDPQIARRLGVNSWNVRACRRRLGIVSKYATKLGQPHSPATRAKLSAGLKCRLEAAGVRSLCQLGEEPRNKRQRRELARRYGLPEDLYLAQVQILLALADGPKTLAELVAATGRGSRKHRYDHAFHYRKAPGSCYLSDLARRGLILRARTCRGKGHGSGAGPGLYLLTPLAMDLMTRTKEDTHADSHS